MLRNRSMTWFKAVLALSLVGMLVVPAAVRADSVLFAVEGYTEEQAGLYTVNSNGTLNLVGNMDQSVIEAFGLSIEPSTDVLFTIVELDGSATRYLATVDRTTAAVTLRNALPDLLEDIAFRSNGELYGIVGKDGASPGDLVIVDPVSADFTATGINRGAQFGHSIAFQPGSGLMYHMMDVDVSECQLESINVDTQNITVINSNVGGGSIYWFDAIAFHPSGQPFVGYSFDEYHQINPVNGGLNPLGSTGLEFMTGLAYFGESPPPPDCNSNGILDACDVDCGAPGGPCDVLGCGASADCNSDGIPDECLLAECSEIDVVFILDTSGSMSDEIDGLCDVIGDVIDALAQQGLTVNAEILSIWDSTRAAGGQGDVSGGDDGLRGERVACSCCTNTVQDLYGTTTPGLPEILGDCGGDGVEGEREEWGPATAIVSANRTWTADATRLIIPLTDEGPRCGDPVYDPGSDRDAIEHAIPIVNSNGVVVSPVIGTPFPPDVLTLAEDLAAGGAPGGRVFRTDVQDLADDIVSAITEACSSATDCNSNGIPDDCDIAAGTSPDLDTNGYPDECEMECYRCVNGSLQTFSGSPDSPVHCYESGLHPIDSLPLACYSWDETADADPPHCGPCCEGGSTSRDPVHLFSGEKIETVEDLRIPGRGFDFVLTRTYRNQAERLTIQGCNWDMSYNIYFELDGDLLVFHSGDLRRDEFHEQPVGSGQYVRGEYLRTAQMDALGDPITMTHADGSIWTFNPLDGSASAGKIDSIVDRNGNTMTFTYSQGYLTYITDTLDRVITFSYNADDYLETVTDWAGRQITYSYYEDGSPYGSDCDLASVTCPFVEYAAPDFLVPPSHEFPLGKTWTYTYFPGEIDDRLKHNLRSITDGKGQEYKVITYETTPASPDYDRVILQELDGDPIDYAYTMLEPSSSNGFAVMRATLIDRVGNVEDHYFDEGHRLVMKRRYHAARNGSGYSETRKVWDSNSQLAYHKAPNGDAVLSKADGTNADPRARGNVLTRQQWRSPDDPAPLTERFDYLQGLGGCCGGGSNFVKWYKDARSNVTSNGFDERGNLIHTQYPIASIVEDWEYNSNGQMTAHVLPENGSGYR
ncbi:MAG: hypothetical protein GY842_17460, partial [bacterium]|nr:hypothetical protein [bacterium]